MYWVCKGKWTEIWSGTDKGWLLRFSFSVLGTKFRLFSSFFYLWLICLLVTSRLPAVNMVECVCVRKLTKVTYLCVFENYFWTYDVGVKTIYSQMAWLIPRFDSIFIFLYTQGMCKAKSRNAKATFQCSCVISTANSFDKSCIGSVLDMMGNEWRWKWHWIWQPIDRFLDAQNVYMFNWFLSNSPNGKMTEK